MAPPRRRAEALAIERLHGADAPRRIAERTAVSAIASDRDGVERFRETARRHERLLTNGTAKDDRHRLRRDEQTSWDSATTSATTMQDRRRSARVEHRSGRDPASPMSQPFDWMRTLPC